MSYAIAVDGMNAPEISDSSGEGISGKIEWHEDDSMFKALIREMEDYYEEQGLVFKIEEHFSTVAGNRETGYVANKRDLVDTVKRVFSNNIETLEKKAEALMNRMHGKVEMLSRITKIESGLRSAQANAKGGPLRIATDSGRYRDLKKLMDNMNQRQGTNHRLEDFGSIRTHGGKTYFTFNKKITGKDGFLSVLDKAANAVSSVNAQDMIELRRIIVKRDHLYSIWSSIIKRIGESITEVNRSTN